MNIASETIDDAMAELYPEIIRQTDIIETSRDRTKELMAVSITLKYPRARLSRSETRGKPFSCLGELLWYLSESDSLHYIKYYIDKYQDESEDGETIYGAYGPRLFNHRGCNQVENVISLLRRKPTSRRAAIQLLDAEDVATRHKEIPCTTTLQFLLRGGRLNMLVNMRSNDAYKGLPHDVFCFTMIQEMIARSIDAEVGSYFHSAGSMHLYCSDLVKAQSYVDEAFQNPIEMPPMPFGDPWPSIRILLKAEKEIRLGADLDADALGLAPYWADLVRLLQVFAASGDCASLNVLSGKMSFSRYKMYIEARKGILRRKETQNKREPA